MRTTIFQWQQTKGKISGNERERSLRGNPASWKFTKSRKIEKVHLEEISTHHNKPSLFFHFLQISKRLGCLVVTSIAHYHRQNIALGLLPLQNSVFMGPNEPWKNVFHLCIPASVLINLIQSYDFFLILLHIYRRYA